MGLPLTVDAWPPAPARTARLVVRAPVETDHDGFAGLATDRPGHFVLPAAAGA